MNLYKNTAHSRGVSIIEALLAAVIIGIGFISVYTMTTISSRMTFESQSRDTSTMAASLIFDDLAMDRFSELDQTYHDGISVARYNNIDFTATCTNRAIGFDAAQTQSVRQQKRWCQTERNTWGNTAVPAPADVRRIFVRDIDITSNGYNQKYKVISLQIEENLLGRPKKYYRKIVHE